MSLMYTMEDYPVHVTECDSEGNVLVHYYRDSVVEGYWKRWGTSFKRPIGWAQWNVTSDDGLLEALIHGVMEGHIIKADRSEESLAFLREMIEENKATVKAYEESLKANVQYRAKLNILSHSHGLF